MARRPSHHTYLLTLFSPHTCCSFAHLKAALTSPSWPSPKFGVRKPEGYVPITPASLLSSPHNFHYGTPSWISGGSNGSVRVGLHSCHCGGG